MVSSVKLHDAHRGKDLQVLVVYPASNYRPGQRFPVIVFSHGAGGAAANYSDLLEYWASHGYVCLAPTHADSLTLKSNPAYTLARVNKVLAEMRLIHGLNTTSNDWVQRAADISFVIDSLPVLARDVPRLGPIMDPHRVGVGGHSYGAFTSMVIGGATIDLPGHASASLADRRATAILVLSGEGPGTMGLNSHSYADLHLPMMVQTGSLDRSFTITGMDWHWRSEPFTLSPPGDKYLLVVQAAKHRTFTGQFIWNPAEKAAFDTVRQASLAFWDAYLKHDSAARTFLGQKQPFANATYSHK